MTHDQLCRRAVAWLRNTRRMNPVFSEKGGIHNIEFPDAIGWNYRSSIVVECKASMADFRGDHLKVCRKYPTLGMGNERYYMCEADMVLPDHVSGGWGLLWVEGRSVRMVKASECHQANLDAERLYLRSRILANHCPEYQEELEQSDDN